MKWTKNFFIATLLSLSLLLGACGGDTLGEQVESSMDVSQDELKVSKYMAQVNKFTRISRESFDTLSDVFEVLEEEDEQEMNVLKKSCQNKISYCLILN